MLVEDTPQEPLADQSVGQAGQGESSSGQMSVEFIHHLYRQNHEILHNLILIIYKIYLVYFKSFSKNINRAKCPSEAVEIPPVTFTLFLLRIFPKMLTCSRC